MLGESSAQSRFEVAVRTEADAVSGTSQRSRADLGALGAGKAGKGKWCCSAASRALASRGWCKSSRNEVVQEGAIRFEFRCSPYYQNSAFYPVIEHVQRLFQFPQTTLLRPSWSKLQQTLARYRFPQADTLPLLAALLSLAPSRGYSTPYAESPEAEAEDPGSVGRVAGGGGREEAGVLCLGRLALG